MWHKWEELWDADPEEYTFPGRVHPLCGHILAQNYLNPHCPNYCASLFFHLEYHHLESHSYFDNKYVLKDNGDTNNSQIDT